MEQKLRDTTITEKGIFFMTFRKNLYWHESKNAFHCSLYDDKSPVHKVKVTEDLTGLSKYHGWFDNEKQEFRMIWPEKQLVQMCFPYGHEIEEEKGRGKLTRLNIEFLEVVRGE